MSLAQDPVDTYLAVSDFEVSMGEKAWLRVRFIPMYERRATGEMIRVERDARAKNRDDQCTGRSGDQIDRDDYHTVESTRQSNGRIMRLLRSARHCSSGVKKTGFVKLKHGS